MRLGAILLHSDVERRRLAGLPAQARSHSAPGAGLYTPEADAALYQHLAVSVEDVIGGGFTAIVDASFALQQQRQSLAALAARLGVRCWLIHCLAPETLLRQRIAQRQREGRDASEADAAVLAWQQQRFEPLEAAPGMTVIEVDTADAACATRVMAALQPPAGGLPTEP